MTGYKKLSDSWALDATEQGEGEQTLATLATLAGVPGQNAFLAGVQGENSNADFHGTKNAKSTGGPAKAAKVAKVFSPRRYRRTFTHLQLQAPPYVREERWQQCLEDGRRFLETWGAQAEALGWTAADLFGLHTPPERPRPFYSRLSRYDETGLIWLLQGRPVVDLTKDTAAIESQTSHNITVYRRHNKPSLGPVGDSLDDFK